MIYLGGLPTSTTGNCFEFSPKRSIVRVDGLTSASRLVKVLPVVSCTSSLEDEEETDVSVSSFKMIILL